MNLYTNQNYDLATKRRKREEYRTILDNQVRQKQKLRSDKQRFQTEGEQGMHLYSPRYMSIEKNSLETPKTRKFQYESNFLPTIDQSISSKRPNFASNHRRSLSYGNENYGMSQDTDIETMEALTECQAIIQNLRKLRLKSLSSMKRKQKQFTYGTSPKNYDSTMDSRYRQKESSAQQQVMMFRGWQPIPNYKNKKPKGKKENQSSVISKKINKKLQLDSGEIDQQQDQFQSLPKSLRKNNKGEQKKENKAGQDQMNKNEDQNENRQLQDQEEQQDRGKKRKFLLKYLAKAKFRGFKLHEKIMEHRNKTISIPNKINQNDEREEQDDENKSQQNNSEDKKSNNQKENKQQQFNNMESEQDWQ